jgi:hypothetical protein
VWRGRRRRASLGLSAAAAAAAIGGLGWWGLQVRPAPFPSDRSGAAGPETVAVPSDLPAPVARFARAAFAGSLPVTGTAIITGRGTLTLGPVTFPARFRFIERGGRDYRHYIECTWFGLPLFKVNEWYVDGRLRQQLPVGTIANAPKADRAASLALWGEMVWLPSVLLTHPRIRWEPIDARSARLVVPASEGEDALTVAFNEQTGLISSMTAQRYRSARDEATMPWRVDLPDWTQFGGIHVPSAASITWLDQGKPWFVMQIETLSYNGDVSQAITASGP